MKTIGTPPASRLLWILAGLFILAGIGYSVLTPVFENSDETLHYPYVKHLADGQGLPLAVPGQLWGQEGTQPPLYYVIVAAATFWIDSDNLADHLQLNPHWLFTEVRALINDNQNLVLHGPMDAFPYHRAALAIHIGRWCSLAFGLVTVVCTFLLGRRLFPGNLPLVVTATALTAFNPQFLRVSATVSNDSLSAALASLTILLALKFTEPANYSFPSDGFNLSPVGFSYRHALLLGLLSGLALLAKLSSLTIFWLVVLIIFWRLFFVGELHQAPLLTVSQWLIIMAATVTVLTGWWFVRNYRLYGEWFATDTHLNLAGRSQLSLVEAWQLRLEAERAYWATFGWGQIRPPEWVYRLFFLLTRLGLAGLVAALLARLLQGQKHSSLPLSPETINFAGAGLLVLWAGLNLVLYLRWVMEVGSVSHTRLVFPAITAISLLLALGWHAWLPRRLAPWFSALVVTLLLALNVYSLGWLIRPAFSPPLLVEPGQELAAEPGPSATNRAAVLNLTFPNKLKLIEAQVYARHGSSTGAPPKNQAGQGDIVMISTLWQTLREMDQNYSVAAVLLAPDGRVLARRETYPGLGLRPTRYLQPDDIFWDTYPLKLEEDIAEPVVARAVVNLFDFYSADRAGLAAVDAQGREVTPAVGQIKLVPHQWPHYQPAVTTWVNFSDKLALVGYDLYLSEARQGLTLYWQSLAPVSEDYVLFLHLLDAAGTVIDQADAPPTHNAYPTSWWSPGEVIADRHTFTASPEVAALRLGLYQLDSLARLPIIDSKLPAQNNSVEIRRP